MNVEGSLDVFWENYAHAVITPNYRVHFARYKNFKSGAQKPKRLVGEGALEPYLIRLNFTQEDAKEWVKKVGEHKSVSIPNVSMTDQFLTDYE